MLLFILVKANAQLKSTNQTFAVDQNIGKYLEKNLSQKKLAVYVNLSDVLMKGIAHAGVNYKITTGVFAEAGLGIGFKTIQNKDNIFAFYGGWPPTELEKIKEVNYDNRSSFSQTNYILNDGTIPYNFHAGIFKSLFTSTISNTYYYGLVFDYNKFNYNYNQDVSASILKNSLTRMTPGFVAGCRYTMFKISRLQFDFNIGVSFEMLKNGTNGNLDDLFNGGTRSSASGIINLKLLGII